MESTRVPITLAELPDWVGKEIAVTPWLQITQDRIDQFASSTNDNQWIHCDPSRAATESPFKGTIAHGYLTLSLLSFFVSQALEITDANLVLNYGLDRVRFPSPVPVGSQLRARIKMTDCNSLEGGVQYRLEVAIEIEGHEKPACVAVPIFRALG